MAKNANTLKLNNLKETEDLPDPVPVVSKEEKIVKPPKKTSRPPRKKWNPDARWVKITGVFFLFTAAYLTLSFISFYLNWFTQLTDDYFSDLPIGLVLTDTQMKINNWSGNMGAFLSQMLVKDGFGLGSFYLVFLFLVAGIRLVWKKTFITGWGLWKYAMMSLIWAPLLLSFAMPTDPLNAFGGVVGLFLNSYLGAVLGKAGLLITIIFIFVVYLVFTISFSFQLFKKKSENTTGQIHDAVNSGLTDKYNTVEYAVDEDDKEDDLVFVIDKKPASSKNRVSEDKGIEMEVDLPEEEPALIQTLPETGIELKIAPVSEEKIKTKGPIQHQGLDTHFDPTLDLPDFKMPPLDLLNMYGDGTVNVDRAELEANKNRIVETLANYSIGIEKIKATIGPTVTLYEIVPSPGIRISRIKNLEDDIALSLSAIGIRIIAPIPGKGTVGIEVPNLKPEIVSMRSILGSDRFTMSNYELPFGIGKTIANESFVADLTKMPHILMAGATGQGKSVGLNAIITSLLYSKHPSELKLVMVDPKKVELSLFSRIERHYLAKLPDSEEAIITDTRKVVRTLNSLSIEMDNRYELLKDAQVRNIKEYNDKFKARKLNPLNGHHFLPYIVLVVDEFADLIMTAGKEVEGPITRLAQLARAVGIHLIIATQRPSVNIITGTIKANFPARIAFRVISRIDSRTILDTGGADQLVGRGDMLLSTGNDLIRLQCAFIDTPEVERLTEYIGSQRAYPDAYHLPEFADEQDEVPDVFDASERDDLFEDAARIIVQNQQGSTSLLQRKLKLGYNRAGRIIDQLEAAGIVGPFEGSKAREVKVAGEMALEQFLRDLDAKTHNNT
ncbi:MAG: DNA segregation ATPase FtsK/SpoIIIE S-DNA-T family [Bacteroidetes bacterium]|nr:MAG: DNA segregation ATPase FtsK/SpoIIIE S-DNA-T family [Bacteroidota bacterium]